MRLEETDLYEEDPVIASRVLEEGFSPYFAKDIKIGDEVIYWQSMFEFSFGECRDGRVIAVSIVPVTGEIFITHTTGDGDSTVECDDESQVWAKREGV